MNKKALVLALVGFGAVVSGCQQIETAKQVATQKLNQGVGAIEKFNSNGTQRTWDEFENKSIRDKFLTLTTTENGSKRIAINPLLAKEKFTLMKRTESFLFLETYVLHEANFAEANRKIRMGAYISEKDLAAKLFVEQALAQGHEVRVYKAPVNKELNKYLKQYPVEFKGAENQYGIDNAFIEFDKTGSAVAIMTRSWQTISTIGVDSRIYTQIYYSPEALRAFENGLGNKFLEDNLLRSIK